MCRTEAEDEAPDGIAPGALWSLAFGVRWLDSAFTDQDDALGRTGSPNEETRARIMGIALGCPESGVEPPHSKRVFTAFLSSTLGHPNHIRNRNPARHRNHSAGPAQYSVDAS